MAFQSSHGVLIRLEHLHPDVLTEALRRLDGLSLAAVSCATVSLRLLSSDPDLWRRLCLSTWPSLSFLSSLSISYRSFFSDAHPFPSLGLGLDQDSVPSRDQLPTKLISAVDLYHKGVPLWSRAVETDASTPWFHGSPFRVDALDRKGETTITQPNELSLSWVVIDPIRGRAVNVSSREAVAVERHWYTGETLVRFATVVGEGERECAVGAVVTCGEGTGHVRGVSLVVEDMNGVCLSGRESLIILKGLMEGGRRRGSVEEAREGYAEHVKRRRWRKERKARREGMMDFCCSAVWVALFVAFMTLVAFSNLCWREEHDAKASCARHELGGSSEVVVGGFRESAFCRTPCEQEERLGV